MVTKYTDSEGNEVETLSPEEYQSLQTERDNLAKEKDDLIAEKTRLETAGADKDENFKSFRTKIDATENELKAVNKKLADKEEYERTSTKEQLFKHFAGDDKEAREKLEKEYGFINIGESTPEQIVERATKAAKLSGLYKEEGGVNPVFQGVFGGNAPFLKPTKLAEDDADNVVNLPKGKSALSAMGVPADYGVKKDDKK